MQEPMAFARIERQRSLHYFANHVLHFLRNIGCSSVQAEGFRRLGTLITSPIRGRFRSAPYQTTTLQAPLEHACLFTLASMARLGGRIYLSCNVVHIGFLFNRILFDRRITQRPRCLCSISLTQWGALKDRGTIRRGSIFGELQNRYAINSSSNNIHGPNAISAPRQCLASPALPHDENRRGQLDRSRS
jgi:hypothetical protein